MMGYWSGMARIREYCFISQSDLLLATWFRIIVKQSFADETSYVWHEMSFHTKWTVEANIAMCLDVPWDFQKQIEAGLRCPALPQLTDIYMPHVAILEGFVGMFDISVWSFRDEIRRVEKVNDVDTLDVI